ncbi:hypothetical protein [Desulfobacula toluolica]|uniref:hypothetical protein n=1 Tax=Desulfobacula toluolica TaxID=28223 RepID=UPI001E2B7639|nr:hypothetical protein [Desulfobacula toluolica]
MIKLINIIFSVSNDLIPVKAFLAKSNRGVTGLKSQIIDAGHLVGAGYTTGVTKNHAEVIMYNPFSISLYNAPTGSKSRPNTIPRQSNEIIPRGAYKINIDILIS